MKMMEMKHVTKDYGNQRGIFDVSFAVKEGEVLGFLGPNGAGKTTQYGTFWAFLPRIKGSVPSAERTVLRRPKQSIDLLGICRERSHLWTI